MLENYYKKYNISRNPRAQERTLKLELEHIQRLYRVWEHQKERFNNKIAEIEANPNLSDKEKEAKKLEAELSIEGSRKRYLAIRKKELAIKDTLDLEQDSVVDGMTRDEKITNTYMTFIFYERKMDSILRLEESAKDKESPIERQEILVEAQAMRKELDEAFNILSNPKLKASYDRELGIQDYAENLKRDKLARIRLSEMYVKSVLGEDFNPDLSKMREQAKVNFRRLESKGKRAFSWKAVLYERPEALFIGKSKHPETPEIDSDIYAFRYGTMEFSCLFRENGEPTYTDGLSEIIGVTKIDKSGRERTEFVIAPLTDLGEIKNVTQQEYEELIGDSQNPIIVETPEEISIREARERYLKRMAKKYPKLPEHDEKRQHSYTRHLKSFAIEDETQSDQISTIEEEPRVREQRKISSENSKIIDLYEAIRKIQMMSGQHYPEDIRHIFLSKTMKQQVLPEDEEFFANVYLSDYLIENAVTNNAGYLGSLDKRGSQRRITFSNPMEEKRIEACFYASEHPGEITKLGAQTGIFAHKVEAHNTSSLFFILENAQKELVKKAKEKKYNDLDQVDL